MSTVSIYLVAFLFVVPLLDLSLALCCLYASCPSGKQWISKHAIMAWLHIQSIKSNFIHCFVICREGFILHKLYCAGSCTESFERALWILWRIIHWVDWDLSCLLIQFWYFVLCWELEITVGKDMLCYFLFPCKLFGGFVLNESLFLVRVDMYAWMIEVKKLKSAAGRAVWL